MYSAAALLPSALPRSEIVTSRPPRVAGEAPVRCDRCLRIEDSSIPAAAASATFGGSTFEVSSAVRAVVSLCCAVVLGASPVPPSPAGSPPR